MGNNNIDREPTNNNPGLKVLTNLFLTEKDVIKGEISKFRDNIYKHGTNFNAAIYLKKYAHTPFREADVVIYRDLNYDTFDYKEHVIKIRY